MMLLISALTWLAMGAPFLITPFMWGCAGCLCLPRLSLSLSQEKKKKLIPWKGVCGVGERGVLSHSTQESYSALHIALGAPTHGRQFHAPWLVS